MSKRRGSGEGSVYLRGDGRWAGVATLKDGRRKFVYGKSQEIAIAELRGVIDARERRLSTSEYRIFKDFADEWLAFKKASVRPRTYDRYEQLIRIYLTPKFGQRQLQEIAPTDMTTSVRRTVVNRSVCVHSASRTRGSKDHDARRAAMGIRASKCGCAC